MKSSSLVLVAAAAAAALLLSSLSSPASAQFVFCGFDPFNLEKACEDALKAASSSRILPSAQCCAMVKMVNIQCLCGFLPPGSERSKQINMVGDLARQCGNPIKGGAKCGGKS